MPMLDDLDALLFEGAARGESTLDGWELRLPGGTDARVARMVSLHETFHGQLNDTSAMGTLLHGLAWVVRNRKDDVALRTLLEGLIGRCRHLHEAYATWLSLHVVGRGQPPLELLDGNERYLAWFARANAVASGLHGPYLRYHAVAAALRACMQGPDLAIALDRGLDRLRLADLPAAAAPDALFRQLAARLTPDLWTRAFAAAREARPDLPGWEVIEANERYATLYDAALAEEHDETSTWLMICFHEAARSVLPVPVLDFDGHLPLVQPLIKAAEALLPAGPVRVPLRAAAPGQTPEAELVGSFKGERLVLRDAPLAAVLACEASDADPTELVCGAGPHAHLFLWAAAGRRWRDQHVWPDGPPTDDDLPLTALRRVERDGETRLLRVWPCTPRALAEAHAALAGDLAVIVCVSMAVYGDETWCREWLPALRQVSLLAVLVDLDPFHHLDLWSRGSGPDFAFAVIELPDDHVPNRVFVLRADGSEHLFLIPCMPLMASSLLHFVRDVVPAPSRFREDGSFLEGPTRMAMSVLLGHLLGEQRVFDFLAGRLLRKERT